MRACVYKLAHRVAHDVCSCCAWFKSFSVHSIEKASLPEFFDGTKFGTHGADVSLIRHLAASDRLDISKSC